MERPFELPLRMRDVWSWCERCKRWYALPDLIHHWRRIAVVTEHR